MKRALVTLLVFCTASLTAQDDPRIAALEAKIVQLELQNRTLKSAIENLAGRPIEQLVGLVETPATVAPAPPAKPAPTAEQLAAMQAVKSRIAELTASTGKPTDPFADRPQESKLRLSAADQAKQRDSQMRELEALKARLAAMEAALQ